MKWLIIFLIASFLSIDPSKISKVNKIKSEAKKAYLSGDMKTAIEKYRFLVDSLQVDEEEVAMNLANAYFNVNDTTSALNHYQPLSISRDSKINSWSNQQMGVVANRQGKFEEALNYFKQAMKAEPDNEQARYNYEMVKKKLEEQKKKEQQKKDNQDKKDDQKKDKKDQKDQDKKDQNKDNKDQKDQKDKKDQQNKDKKDDQKKDQKDKQDQKDKEQKDKEQKEQQKKRAGKEGSTKQKRKEQTRSFII